MAKLDIRNIYLKNQKGELYRICGVTNPIDSIGEKYIKLVFPDLKNIPLIGKTNDALMNVTESEFLKNGVIEFSYHYRSGVSHYKEPSQVRVDQKRCLPTISEKGGLHLLILKIHSLVGFKVKDKTKIRETDVILFNSFNNMTREISFMLFKNSDFYVENLGIKKKALRTYKIVLNDGAICLGLFDVEWISKPKNPIYGVQVFRYDDPILFLTPPESQFFMDKDLL